MASRVLEVVGAPPVVAIASAWLVLAALTSALHLAVARTAWNLGGAAESFRLPLLGHAVSSEIVLAVAIGIFAYLSLRPARETLGDRVITTGAHAAGALLAALWFASWALFVSTGQFLDQVSVSMSLANPWLMSVHAFVFAPLAFFLVPLLGVALMGVIRTATRWASRRPRQGRVTVILVAGIALVVSEIASDAGFERFYHDIGPTVHPETGGEITVGGLFREAQRDRASPLAHVTSELLGMASEYLQGLDPDPSLVDWRPLHSVPEVVPAERWNVVVVVVESLRSDELEAYGSELPVMPELDRIARESAVFLDHYAAATHSNYSSVVPVSSQYPLRDVTFRVFPEDPPYPRVLLHDVLKPAGYRTAIVSSQNELWGGMAHFLETENLDYFLHGETYDGPTYVSEDDLGFVKFVSGTGHAGKIDDSITATEAMRWMAEGSPFTIYVNFQNSHVPYPIPRSAPTPFGPRDPPFPIGFNDFPNDSSEIVRGVYRNALHYVDAQIGRMAAFLKEEGLWESTIFVVAGDHGQAFYEHGFASHGNRLFEELLRTPLVIHAPGLEPGPREGLAHHVDIAPTILDLLGAPPHPGFQGTSLLDGPRQFAYSVVQTSIAHEYGILRGDYKLLLDPEEGEAVLRDLAVDPTEARDASALHPELAADLRYRLESWIGAQLRYYGSDLLQTRYFAPIPRGPKATESDAGDSGAPR